MYSEQLKSVLERASRWPQEWQERLLKLAAEIEAELSKSPHEASSDELRSIDAGLAGETASQEEVKNAYAKLRGS